MELKKLLSIALRRKWLILQALVVIIGIAMAGTFMLPPTYETSAKILYELPTPQSSLLSNIGIKDLLPQVPPMTLTGNIGTKVTLAQVDPLLEDVIRKLQVRDRNGVLLDPYRLLNPSIVSRLLPSPYIYVAQDTNSNTISIIGRSSDADEAQYLVNTLTTFFIERNGNQNREQLRSVQSFVAGQLGKVKADYYRALEDMADFRRSHHTIDLDLETKVAIEKIAELMKQKEDNVIDIDQSLAKIRTVKERLKAQGSTVTTSLLRENPQIEGLKRDIADLRSKLANVLAEKTSQHPDALAVQKQITELEEELKGEVAVYHESVPELNDLEKELASQRTHLSGVNKDIDRYVARFGELPETSKEFEKLRLALTASQSVYSSLLDYSNQINIASSIAINDLRLVEAAPRPLKPKLPKKVLNLVAGSFLGLIFGLGLALAREYTDNTIKTPEELSGLGGPLLLGSIPRSRHRLIDRLDNNDPLCEAYRTIRNSLHYISLERQTSSLLITSTGPLEGKSTVVANLAISYSRSGKRVLVIDTDLRRPSLHKLFGLGNTEGLTDVLGRGLRISEAVQPTGIENLSLLPSGPTPPDAGMIVESGALQRLIEVLRMRYDVVVLDSAPLLVKSDAAVIGHYVDGVIYLIEAAKVNEVALKQAGEIFEKAGLVPLGAVLNKFREERETTSLKKGRRARRRALVLAALAVALSVGAVFYWRFYLS